MVESVFAAMTQIVLADGGEESARVNVIDKALPRVSLRRGVARCDQLLHEARASSATLGFCKF